MKCKLCLSEKIVELGKVGNKGVSVTSDSKLCLFSSTIYFCNRCQHLQKIYNKKISSVVDEIYSGYEAHNISSGNEPLVFPDNLPPRARTYHAIENCIPFLPETGNLLDFGSGNGAALKSASKLLPKWTLNAFDIVDNFKEEIMKIPNVKSFYARNIESLPSQKFNLIIIWHVLEHIEQPASLLLSLRERLTNDGHLLIQVPDVSRNFYDLAVIDHCSHFTKNRLIKLFNSIGFKVVLDGYNWFHNCNTLLLGLCNPIIPEMGIVDDGMKSSSIYMELNETVKYFDTVVNQSDYAIFGTGMASIWLSGELTKPPIFFIDEAEERRGKVINNISVLSPLDISHRCEIIMPFTHEVGNNLKKKLQSKYDILKNCKFIIPTIGNI